MVESSVLMVIYGCGCCNPSKNNLIGMAVWELGDNPAVLASAAEETTCILVLHSTRIAIAMVGHGVLSG